MWNYSQCVEEFNKRRGKSAPTKKTHRNVYMRYEEDDVYSTFIFKMYRTDIVKVQMDRMTREVHHIITGGGWERSNTTRERIHDIAGVYLFGHPKHPTWQPVNDVRSSWPLKRQFNIPVLGKTVEVVGYPFISGTAFRDRTPIGDFTKEEFKVLDPQQELNRKRMMRPWLEAVKVAIGLLQGGDVKTLTTDTDPKQEMLHAIKKSEPIDMALVLNAVQYEWERTVGRYTRNRLKNTVAEEVYREVTGYLFANTRYEVKQIMVTGYLLDERK